jgi:hypothetical protein
MLTGQDRYDWIKRELSHYNRRRRIPILLFFIDLIVAVLIIYGPFSLDLSGRQAAAGSLLLGYFALIFVLSKTRENPVSLEDRILNHIHDGLVDLKAYADKGDRKSRKRCVKSLKKAARIIDRWQVGNLEFLKEGIGKEIEKFQKGFRYGLIPTIRDADKSKAQGFILILTSYDNILQQGSVNASTFPAWNNLWNTVVPKPPGAGRWKRLVAAENRLRLLFVSLILISPFLLYGLATEYGHFSPEGSFGYSVVLFVGLLTAYATASKKSK